MTLVTIDLRAEAAAEAKRLSRARAIVRPDDERVIARLEGDGVWIATSRGAKRALGRRVCLLWRVAFEDGSGRVVESRLVPILVDVESGPRQRSPSLRAWIRSLLLRVDEPARARIDADCSVWRREVHSVANAFTAARLAREHAVAVSRPPLPDTAVQTGLFDRRAERGHQDRVAAAAECVRLLQERERAAAGAIALVAARLLLVLVP